jgi:hypothetical protein
MLGYNRIGLFSPGSLVSNSVEGSLDMVNSHSVVVGVIHTHPSESDSFKLPFKLRINADALSVAEVNQRSSDLGAVVMLPQVFNQTLQGLFYTLYS